MTSHWGLSVRRTVRRVVIRVPSVSRSENPGAVSAHRARAALVASGLGPQGVLATAGAVWMAAAAVGAGEPDDGGSAVCPGFHRPPPRDRESYTPPAGSSPRLRPPDGTGTASAFTPGSAPRGYPQRTPGRRRANAHWPGYRTHGLSRTSNSTSHLTHVPSRRTSCTVASMVSRRAGRTFSHLACGTGMHSARTAPARRALRADWQGSASLTLTC